MTMSRVAANVDDALSAHTMSDAAVLDTQAASDSLVEGANVVENLEHCGFDPLSSYVTVLGTGALGTAIYSQLILNGAERLYVFNDSETLADQAKNDVAMVARKTGVEIQLFDASNRGVLKQLRYVLQHRELRGNNQTYK